MNKTLKTVLVAAIIGTVAVVVHFFSMQNILSFMSVPQGKALMVILPPAAATVFAWLAWSQESSRFALVSAILFLADTIIWGTGLFLYIAPAILLFVSYRQMRNN